MYTVIVKLIYGKNLMMRMMSYMKHLEVTTQQKYLGYILSNDGTHIQSIKMRTNKSIGTNNTFKTLIKGRRKYTFETL